MPTKLNHVVSGYVRVVMILLLISVLMPVKSLNAQQRFDLGGEVASDPVQISAELNDTNARPGDQRVIAVIAEMAETYHINPNQEQIPKEFSFLIPTTVTVKAENTSIEVGAVQYPKPHQVIVNFTGEESQLPAYDNKTIFYVPVVVKGDASAGEYPIKVNVDYQTCNDRACLAPTDKTIDLMLTIKSPEVEAAVAVPVQPNNTSGNTDQSKLSSEITTSSSKTKDASLFDDFDATSFGSVATTQSSSNSVKFDAFGYSFGINTTGFGFALVLLVAMLGGFLLNLTPCVLPVIPIKIMGMSKAAGNRVRCLMLGIWMSVGVVAFWLILGGFISSIASVSAISVLFQYWWFTIGIGIFIAVMAVGMCGVFAIQLPQSVYQISPKQDTATGSIGFGVMTAILSTPCTAPFMGGAAAWALDKNLIVTLTVFGSIGFGMALPYLILSANPKWVEKMPRTGPASELIKQIMGLLMLAASAYFIGVGFASIFSNGTEATNQLYWWAVMGFIALAGLWLIIKTWSITPSHVKRTAWTIVGSLTVIASLMGAVKLTEEGPIKWQYYTPEKFNTALEQGNVIVLDFTADWCLNCKTLENTVLSTDRVVSALGNDNVIPMKVDLTSRSNEEGWAKLKDVGRVTIPLLVIYSPDGQQVFESDWYTADQVVDSIDIAKAKS
ncbi:thioredoxin family protein [Planctomycetota bacterium]|nr:thioredoxin family protein [Planctomycetota bacterium]